MKPVGGGRHGRSSQGVALPGLVLLVTGLAAPIPATASPPSPGTQRAPRVEDSPGYYPPSDPESGAVRLGRRAARLVDTPFTGGERSLHELAQRFLRASSREDLATLRALCVTREEFAEILWPEFPQSRPATGLTAEDAWFVLAARLENGLRSAVAQAAGRDLRLVRVERTAITSPFANFRLLDGLELVVADERGQLERWKGLRTTVERGGKFKIYSMKD